MTPSRLLESYDRDCSRAALAAALLAVSFAGCQHATSAPPAPVNQARKVEVVRPNRQTLRQTIEQPGQIESFEAAPIHAKLSGYVQELSADIGLSVKKGQVLATLSMPECEAELVEKTALVELARAKLNQADAASEVAKAAVNTSAAKVALTHGEMKRTDAELARWQAEYARTKQLVDERTVTASVLDETRSKLRAAEAARDSANSARVAAEAAKLEAVAALDKSRADAAFADAGVAVAHADRKKTEALLAYTKITAPFDGVVTHRNIETGQLTVVGAQAEPLFVVARTDLLRVVVAVPELFAGSVFPGAKASIRVQAIPGREFPAPVARTSWALDNASRTLTAQIDLTEPDKALRPGLYAIARIVVNERVNALTIPSSSIGKAGETNFCMVVVNGKAQRRTVRLGLNDGANAEIVAGLEAADVVVMSNPGALVEGQPVDAIEPAKPAAAGIKP